MNTSEKKIQKAQESLSKVEKILTDESLDTVTKYKAVENIYKLQPSFYFGIIIGATLLTTAIFMIVKPSFLKGFLTTPITSK